MDADQIDAALDKPLLVDALDALLFADDNGSYGTSTYIALARLFLAEARKEMSGEPLRRMSPATRLALRDLLLNGDRHTI